MRFLSRTTKETKEHEDTLRRLRGLILNQELGRFFLCLLCHLRVEALGSFFHLLLGQALGTSTQAPVVAIRVCKVSKAVAPERVGHRHGHFAADIEGGVDSGAAPCLRANLACRIPRGELPTADLHTSLLK